MLICEVVGNIWATKKDGNMGGAKLMMVKQYDYFSKLDSEVFVAADIVGAGIGEKVLVVSGSTARRALGHDDVPIDTVIVGIIDSIEVERDLEARWPGKIIGSETLDENEDPQEAQDRAEED